jgi:hypothetical protein
MRRRRSWGRGAWILGAAVLAAAAGVAWWAMSPRASSLALQDAGRQMGEGVPDEGYVHVVIGSEIHYQAHPPSSGPHYPIPAATGVYPDGLASGFWVHSLEHGYIVVVYRPPVPADLVTQFQEMVKDFPASKYGNVKLVIAPYDTMLHPFAVLAWDRRMWMDAFDRAKVLQFYRAYVDHGREDIP